MSIYSLQHHCHRRNPIISRKKRASEDARLTELQLAEDVIKTCGDVRLTRVQS